MKVNDISFAHFVYPFLFPADTFAAWAAALEAAQWQGLKDLWESRRFTTGELLRQLCEVVRGVLRGQARPSPTSFLRLRSAGLMSGDSPPDIRPRCRLYTLYLEHHLL